MGASLQARKNPFEAQGLVPGVTLRLEVFVGQDVEELSTRLETVQADRLGVLVPIMRRRPRPLPTGSMARVSYVRNRLRHGFLTEVMGHSDDGELDFLVPPSTIESSDRRSAFRLVCSLKPKSLYRLVIDPDNPPAEGEELPEATVIDLSEGGVGLITRNRVSAGERLGIQVELPEAGELKARLRVVGINEPTQGGRLRRVHCTFLELSRYDRDLVARFLMKRQLEMRRKGQL
jgi:c-di-GMP-binding flagellar brake protein YcgR